MLWLQGPVMMLGFSLATAGIVGFYACMIAGPLLKDMWFLLYAIVSGAIGTAATLGTIKFISWQNMRPEP